MPDRYPDTIGRVGATSRPAHQVPPIETDAEYLARIDGEIAAGLNDLETGNVVSAAEHKAHMKRLLSELRARPSRDRTISR